MKKALKFLAATLAAFSLLGFMSCDDEESTTYYKITVGATEHGTVDCLPEQSEGGQFSLSIDSDSNYTIGDISVKTASGKELTCKEERWGNIGCDGYFYYTMPAENVTVTVTFEERTDLKGIWLSDSYIVTMNGVSTIEFIDKSTETLVNTQYASNKNKVYVKVDDDEIIVITSENGFATFEYEDETFTKCTDQEITQADATYTCTEDSTTYKIKISSNEISDYGNFWYYINDTDNASVSGHYLIVKNLVLIYPDDGDFAIATVNDNGTITFDGKEFSVQSE
ncbi:MAG: hypothetical protein IJ717_12795 [Treponema sp.]|uniref:hypothetical protein n=1 Tax=Treponema sp. TaxID=166 RepID=UPI0025EF6896|nr:hypothetical protein [Treponema sp.]MBQ9283368.1 hypothetical protein [Treponema sp.]MBR1715805.1 hypothetical protein [Treponema sp.]